MKILKDYLKRMAGFLKQLASRYSKHSVSAYSAQMAFFLMLSIFPFFIFLFTVLGKLSINSDILMMVLENFFPKEVHQLTIDFIEKNIVVEGNSLVSISILGIIWSASKGVRALMVSLNKAYEIKETRSFIIVKVLDMVYTVLIVIVILLLLTLPNIGVGVFRFVGRYIEINWEIFETYNLVKRILIPSTLTLLMGLIYMYVPNIKLKIKDVIWGTVFSIVGWSILSYFFTIFVNEFANYRVVYGSLATVIILMFWLYFSSILLIVGGEINSIVREKNN
ncbi:MAG TPA: YihY/virulence factor BrkB family protein [Clostridia bacterium]|nr:YihY/virulence factor BrkB family protein [Clostridia bacterium]